MDRDEGYPGIELLRQPDEVFGLGKEGLNKYSEKANEDWQLHNQGSKTSDGTYARLPVQLHSFLGDPGTVTAVALLDFAHSRLQFTHPPHLANLLEGKGQCYQPDQDGKGDDGQPHVVEAEHVEHHQGVQHGANYDFIPEKE